MQLDTEVLIVGAGPTGLMLGCQLLRFGIAFRLIDKQADRAHESRAFGIQAKSMEIFQNLGISDEFVKRANQVKEINFFVSGELKLRLELDHLKIENSPFSTFFFLPQSETERILIEYLEKHGHKVERQITLETFSPINTVIKAIVKDETSGVARDIYCSYIVGCDGAHSIVRKLLDIPFIGGDYAQNFFLADASVSWPPPMESKFMLFLDQQGIFLHAPLDKNLSRIIGAGVNLSKEAQQPLTVDEIQLWAKKITHKSVSVINVVWKTRFYLHHPVVSQYQKGQVLLAGDAAHVHSPVGAQGMNTGLQDATNLAWKLALVIKHGATEELLTTYQLERQFIGKKLTQTTDRIFWILTSPNIIFKILRPLILSLAMRIIRKSFRIQKRLFWLMSQLGIYYLPNKFIYEKEAGADVNF